jgi:hypothetical protein
MKPPLPDAPVHPKTLTEQKTDFTAEGSPPPGKVVGSVPPVTPDMLETAQRKPRKPTKTAEATSPTRTTPPQRKGPARLGKY